MSELEDDELEAQPDQRTRIARPSQPGTLPAATLRGLGAPAPSPETGSVDNLEERGLASHTAPRPIATPSPLEARTSADQNEFSRLQTSGSGVSQIAKAHPVAGGILRGLGTAGSILGAVDPFARRILPNIPGTEEHHNQLLGRQAGRIGEDLGEQKTEAATGEATARTGQAEAAAEKDKSDAEKLRQEAAVAGNPKVGITPEEVTIHDLMTGNNGGPRVNPQTGKPFTYFEAYSTTMQAKQDTKPDPAVKDKEQDISDYLAAHKLEDTPANREQARQGIANRSKDFGAKSDARADKSYQLQSGRLDKVRQPVDQVIQRVGRLNDTLNQNSPQADALIAPELLSIMAGGAGSGLRMNEAEIARIVGGRSAWENLKGSFQHWSTNPEEARSITPDQDKQIRALVGAVHSKLAAKQQILDATEDALIASDDPKEHRRIVADARKKLDAIDGGGAENKGGGTVNMKAPDGTIKPIPADQVEHYKSRGATVAP